MNNELERILEEAILIQQRVLFRKFHGGIEETHDHLSQGSRFHGRGPNIAPREYKSKALPLHHPSACENSLNYVVILSQVLILYR